MSTYTKKTLTTFAKLTLGVAGLASFLMYLVGA